VKCWKLYERTQVARLAGRAACRQHRARGCEEAACQRSSASCANLWCTVNRLACLYDNRGQLIIISARAKFLRSNVLLVAYSIEALHLSAYSVVLPTRKENQQVTRRLALIVMQPNIRSRALALRESECAGAVASQVTRRSSRQMDARHPR
jgi:hypothetical protein